MPNSAELPANRPSDNAPDGAGVVERLKVVFGIESDGDLAQLLGVPGTMISAWRNGSPIPLSNVVAATLTTGASVAGILYGEEHVRPTTLPPLDTSLMAGVLSLLVRDGYDLPLLTGAPGSHHKALAADICRYWRYATLAVQELTGELRMGKAAAFKVVFGSEKSVERPD